MLTRLWFLLSLAWALLLLCTLNWPQLDAGETKRMLFIALLPLIGGLVLKRMGRYIARGD